LWALPTPVAHREGGRDTIVVVSRKDKSVSAKTNTIPPVTIHTPSLPQVEQEKFFPSASLKKFFLLRLLHYVPAAQGAVRRSRPKN
jgi:hypothetical protein